MRIGLIDMNTETQMSIIAKTIKENRINKGYSLKELANLTFLPVSTVKRAEHGSLFVKFDEYIKIFYVLNMIHPDFL